MSNSKVVKGRTSVLDRTKQYETLSHSQLPESPTPGEGHTGESDSEDDGFDFAALVKNIAGENQATSGVTESDALREAFNILDYDEDGFISVSDLRTALKMFDDEEAGDAADAKEPEVDEEGNEHEENENDVDEGGENEATIHEMIDEADYDKDGKISFNDFLQVLSKSDESEALEPVEEESEKEKKSRKKHRKHAR